MFDLGGGELLLILIAVLIFFGPKKLPELAKGMGKGIREFKRAQQEFTSQINSAFEEEERKSYTSAARPATENTIARSRPTESIAQQTTTEANGNTAATAFATGVSAEGSGKQAASIRSVPASSELETPAKQDAPVANNQADNNQE